MDWTILIDLNNCSSPVTHLLLSDHSILLHNYSTDQSTNLFLFSANQIKTRLKFWIQGMYLILSFCSVCNQLNKWDETIVQEAQLKLDVSVQKALLQSCGCHHIQGERESVMHSGALRWPQANKIKTTSCFQALLLVVTSEKFKVVIVLSCWPKYSSHVVYIEHGLNPGIKFTTTNRF